MNPTEELVRHLGCWVRHWFRLLYFRELWLGCREFYRAVKTLKRVYKQWIKKQ
jgi:hypothetical protein